MHMFQLDLSANLRNIPFSCPGKLVFTLGVYIHRHSLDEGLSLTAAWERLASPRIRFSVKTEKAEETLGFVRDSFGLESVMGKLSEKRAKIKGISHERHFAQSAKQK